MEIAGETIDDRIGHCSTFGEHPAWSLSFSKNEHTKDPKIHLRNPFKSHPSRSMATMGGEEKEKKQRIISSLRVFLCTVFSVCAFFVFIGAGLNDLDLKYARASSRSRQCKKELYILSVPDSTLCCEVSYHEMDWVCAASFEPSHKIFTSMWALIIPLSPLLMTIVSDLGASVRNASNGLCPVRLLFQISTDFFPSNWFIFSPLLLTQLSINGSFNFSSFYLCQVDTNTIKAHSIRFLLYVLIILYRTYVLYVAGGYVQSTLQDVSSSSTSCWYAMLTRDGICKDHFDYSDHIVLYLAQYCVPLSIELAYVYSISNHNRFHMLLRYFLTVLVSMVLLGISIRGILLTSMFFHTGMSNYALLIQ